MEYFLKSIGIAGTEFQVDWWHAKHELHDAVYFGREPKPIVPGSCLIDYAVQTGGMLVGVAEVMGKPRTGFRTPTGMTSAWAEKFKWLLPVRVLHHRLAEDACPRLSQFTPTPMGPGSFKRVDASLAVRMIDAIAAHARR